MDIFLQLSKYAGLLSTIIVPILFYIGWRKNKFKLIQNTLSDCGASKKTARLFSLTLILFSILEVIFSFSIITSLLPNNLFWLIYPPAIACLFFFIPSIFNDKTFRFVHLLGASLAILILLLWCFYLQISLYMYHEMVGSIGMVITLIMFVLPFIWLLKYKLSAIPEIIFIGSIFIWNLFYTLIIW